MRRVLTGFLCLLLGTVLVPAAFAAKESVANASGPNPKVFPVYSRPYGLSYADWSARFWQWAFSMPVDHHPLYDTADCSEGQSGRVWFLGATFAPTVGGGGEILAYAERECNVPAGVALFIPIINAEASTLEGNGTTEAELRAAAQSFQDLAQNLWCEVDGYVIRDLDAYRVQSPLYTFGPLPDNNLFQSIGIDAPAGTMSQSVADGVHIILAPLPAGSHTIHFKGELPDFNFFVDITYHLNVVAGTEDGDAPESAVLPGQETHWGLLKARYRP
ncbi:MAG TPA: hypothetical protein VFP10_01115 [Candidatus Eisenbacteria bacterium]|nr:hypothetical protein [Candidatus Eisenbacteria bacterium]